jgi:hypothetical protein
LDAIGIAEHLFGAAASAGGDAISTNGEVFDAWGLHDDCVLQFRGGKRHLKPPESLLAQLRL